MTTTPVRTLRRLLAIVVLPLLAASCASWREPGTPPAAPPTALTPKDDIPPFSLAQPGSGLPAGWKEWILHPVKRRTNYSLVQEQGRTVLTAHAERSASGVIAEGLDIDPTRRPILEWTWRSDTLLTQADNEVASLEDAPVRLVLAFDGDKSTLPIKDRLFAERVKLLSGRDLPYATLMYIWGNRRDRESLLPNPHTQRIKKLVVDSGPQKLKQWQRHRRNIVEDFRRAYGKDPGRLIAVAVMTDTDNTGDTARAYYGDIRVLPEAAPAGAAPAETSPRR